MIDLDNIVILKGEYLVGEYEIKDNTGVIKGGCLERIENLIVKDDFVFEKEKEIGCSKIFCFEVLEEEYYL